MHTAKTMDNEQTPSISGVEANFRKVRAEMFALLNMLLDPADGVTSHYRTEVAADAYIELSAEKADIERLMGQAKEVISQGMVEEGKTELTTRRAKITVTDPYLRVGYKAEQVDTLVFRLLKTHPDIAEQLMNCRQETEVAGTMRITRRTNH